MPIAMSPIDCSINKVELTLMGLMRASWASFETGGWIVLIRNTRVLEKHTDMDRLVEQLKSTSKSRSTSLKALLQKQYFLVNL